MRACEIKALHWRDIDSHQSPSACAPIENAGGLAIADTQPDLPGGAAGAARSRREVRIHAAVTTSSSPGTAATSRSTRRGAMTSWRAAWRSMRKAAGLAARALPRRTAHRNHHARGKGIGGLGDSGAGGTRLAGDDEDLQPHPPAGPERSRGRARADGQAGPNSDPTPAAARRVRTRTQSYVTVHVTIGPSDRSRTQIC